MEKKEKPIIICTVCHEIISKRQSVRLEDSPMGLSRRACKHHDGIETIAKSKRQSEVARSQMATHKERWRS